jgi:polyisoprenyl-teichoic acid--peptidoglycan teichoic acid transferase
MVYLPNNNNQINPQFNQIKQVQTNFMQPEKKKKFYSKKWFKITAFFVVLLFIVGGVAFWKMGSTLGKISKGNIFNNIVKSIPGVPKELKAENGRTNVLLLGMRGENIPGGGLLADTIMVVSIVPAESKIAMISIPRDLYVTVPGTSDRQKINAVHHYGEQKGKGQGLEDMKTSVGEVLGIPIHYAVSINFEGFKQLIDAVGGVEITLDQPFEEAMQFNEPHVCDSFFTVPTGKYDNKIHKIYDSVTGAYKRSRIVKSYPLCTAPKDTLECGGDFKLPAGKQTLNGSQSLCYVRSRVTTSDFERAKRQQMMLQLLKSKLLSAGTLTDFGKINDILDSLGDNVRSDMEAWEMAKFFDLYKASGDYQNYQRVLENSEEGLLYNPPMNDKTIGYILLPIGDNYDKIHAMAQDIFTLPAQSDIKPK